MSEMHSTDAEDAGNSSRNLCDIRLGNVGCLDTSQVDMVLDKRAITQTEPRLGRKIWESGDVLLGAGWYEHEQYAAPSKLNPSWVTVKRCTRKIKEARGSSRKQHESRESREEHVWLGLLGLVFSLTMGHVEPRWKSRQATVLRVYSDNLWILREGNEILVIFNYFTRSYLMVLFFGLQPAPLGCTDQDFAFSTCMGHRWYLMWYVPWPSMAIDGQCQPGAIAGQQIEVRSMLIWEWWIALGILSPWYNIQGPTGDVCGEVRKWAESERLQKHFVALLCT